MATPPPPGTRVAGPNMLFIPLIPLAPTGAHVQCLTCKTRYVTEVLKLPATVQMQVALVAGL